ncbi:hypothetical protein H5410_056152 [Solanum commersonii]|uniref:Uncharacterized protein n=1 Tax=Solanum commersonii TaxID=4109 RepID=A0A9J5WKF6_SOLCO|nr:hypothetical protein H5410_056152 [Solanum commersonii]
MRHDIRLAKSAPKKVKVIEHIVSYNNCNSENVEYEMRYFLQLEMCGGEQHARFILLPPFHKE